MTGEEQERGVRDHQGKFNFTNLIIKKKLILVHQKVLKEETDQRRREVQRSLLFFLQKGKAVPYCVMLISQHLQGEKSLEKVLQVHP